jgi:hypothetical protein
MFGAPALVGMAFYVQWAVDDPQGALTVNGHPVATSDARTILVW